MNVRHIFLIGLLMICDSTHADESRDATKVPSTVAWVKTKKSVEVQPTNNEKIVHWQCLISFSVTPGKTNPESFILTGRVVSNNTGGAWERLPIFFGSPLHSPKLAALSDADGRFSFRVYLKQDHRDTEFQTPTLAEGAVYLGGSFDDQLELTHGLCRIYSLADLQKPENKQK